MSVSLRELAKELADFLNDDIFIYENTDDDGLWIAECLEKSILPALIGKCGGRSEEEIAQILVNGYAQHGQTHKEVDVSLCQIQAKLLFGNISKLRVVDKNTSVGCTGCEYEKKTLLLSPNLIKEVINEDKR
jgi:hypothetical protein